MIVCTLFLVSEEADTQLLHAPQASKKILFFPAREWAKKETLQPSPLWWQVPDYALLCRADWMHSANRYRHTELGRQQGLEWRIRHWDQRRQLCQQEPHRHCKAKESEIKLQNNDSEKPTGETVTEFPEPNPVSIERLALYLPQWHQNRDTNALQVKRIQGMESYWNGLSTKRDIPGIHHVCCQRADRRPWPTLSTNDRCVSPLSHTLWLLCQYKEMQCRHECHY